VSEVDPRYNDSSIRDDDRLPRAFPHGMYSHPPLAADERVSQIGTGALSDRLSSQGFQAISDKHSGMLGMSVYLERLLQDEEDPIDLLRYLSIDAKGPLSLIVIPAGDVRRAPPDFRKEPPKGPPLGIVMDEVDEPFGRAHANVIYPQEGGRQFSDGTKNWMVRAAQVLIPELP